MKNTMTIARVITYNINSVSSRSSYNYENSWAYFTPEECVPQNEVQLGVWRVSIVEGTELYLCHEDSQDNFLCLEWEASSHGYNRKTQISGLAHNPHYVQRLYSGTVLIRHGDDIVEVTITDGGDIHLDIRSI